MGRRKNAFHPLKEDLATRIDQNSKDKAPTETRDTVAKTTGASAHAILSAMDDIKRGIITFKDLAEIFKADGNYMATVDLLDLFSDAAKILENKAFEPSKDALSMQSSSKVGIPAILTLKQRLKYRHLSLGIA